MIVTSTAQTAVEEPTALSGMALDELAASSDAARLVARLTRRGVDETEPVRVAAFNSYI